MSRLAGSRQGYTPYRHGKISCRFAGDGTLFVPGNPPLHQNESQIMKSQTTATSNDLGTLAEDARALMAATADVAGEKVGEARKRLATALESAKDLAGRVRDKAVEGAKAADEAVHEHPYRAIAIAVGVGAILGYLLTRRCSRGDD